MTFNEKMYLLRNPDVAAAVQAGAFGSGLQHYEQYGQFEEGRPGYFNGTIGNDVVTGFGELTGIAGIDYEVSEFTNGVFSGVSINAGVGEVDTLIGGAGTDVFRLSFLQENPQDTLQPFYVGGGNADYALIQNFDPDADFIRLGGTSSSQYNLQVLNGSLNISTLSGDLIGIVEGVTSLPSELPGTSPGEFYLGFPS